MKKVKPTEIVMIVDRSGSMQAIQSDSEGGINAFLEDRKKEAVENKEVYITLAQFDDHYDLIWNHLDAKEITSYKLQPRGMTSLHDALGKTLTTVHATHKEKKFKGKTIVVIVTDGMENASREWNGKQVKDLISSRKKGKWEFIFLAAKEEAIGGGIGYGVQTFNTVNIGQAANYRAVSVAAASVVRGQSASFNQTYSDETGLTAVNETEED